MTTVLIIRHATNDAVGNQVLTGRTPGVHLNEQGRAQAQALGERLAGVDLAAIYSSPMERTQETAWFVADPHGLEIQFHPGLHEADFGRWTGQPLEKLRRRRLWRAVQTTPSQFRFPGGESFYEIQTRMVSALEDIRSSHPEETVAVVSHADPIKVMLAHYLGLSLDLFQRLLIAPASLTVLMFDGLTPRLVCVSDTGHLTHAEKSGKGK